MDLNLNFWIFLAILGEICPSFQCHGHATPRWSHEHVHDGQTYCAARFVVGASEIRYLDDFEKLSESSGGPRCPQMNKKKRHHFPKHEKHEDRSGGMLY